MPDPSLINKHTRWVATSSLRLPGPLNLGSYKGRGTGDNPGQALYKFLPLGISTMSLKYRILGYIDLSSGTVVTSKLAAGCTCSSTNFP